MKIVIIGKGKAAINCLDVLLSDSTNHVLVVTTHLDMAHAWHESLAKFSLEKGLEVIFDPGDINHPVFIARLKRFAPDLILSVYADDIFKEKIIEIPRLGCVNVHPSLLPQYRGTSPLIWVLIEGETKTGVTFHFINKGIDTGDIIFQEGLPISLDDTGYSLHQKAAGLIKQMMKKFMDLLAQPKGLPRKKQKGTVTYFAKSRPKKNFLDWDVPASAVYNCVRALTRPLPGCYGYIKKEKVHVWQVAVLSESQAPQAAGQDPQPGLCLAQDGKFLVKTNPGWIQILEAGVDGLVMSGSDFLEKHPLNPGDVFEKKPPESSSRKYIPFGMPCLGKEEINEVVDTLESTWIGTGHKTMLFEKEFASFAGAPYAVSVNSCTAALHLSLLVSGVGPGDEVITTPMTFAATANAIIHAGARPVFADIDLDTLNIDPAEIEKKMTPKTKAVLPVHFGGLPCDMQAIQDLAARHGVTIIEDAAHAIGSVDKGQKIGGSGRLTCFSFYANKNLTTAEGGMITTSNASQAERLKVLRLHGLNHDAWGRYKSRQLVVSDVMEVGYKYNMTDIQASLGLHQLRKMERFLSKREHYARLYDEAFKDIPALSFVNRQSVPVGSRHGLHLYLLLLNLQKTKATRNDIVVALRQAGVGAAVHYIALPLHPYYRDTFGYKPGDFKKSEWISDRIFTLPLSPAMSEKDVLYIIETVKLVINKK